MKRNLSRKWTSWLMTTLLLLQTLAGARPVFAEENNEIGPQLVSGEKGTVIYNPENVFRLYGTKNGGEWSDTTSTMILETNNGETELVFCIEPGVPLSGGIETTDYESVEANNVSHRSQVAAAIWKRVFPNQTVAEQITTQAVIWENLTQYGLDIHEIDDIPNFRELKNRLNQAIDEYDEKPAFHNQTIELEYGEETQLQSGGVNLNLFDTLVENTANLTYDISPDGQLLTLTPTDITKQQGSLKFKSSYMEGTPLAFEKEGSQTVMVARIQNTTSYQVNVHIQTLGKVQIQKVDKTTGDPVPGTKFEVEVSGKIQTVETDSQGQATLENIPHGAVVKAKEVFVPAPYILASTLGESDIVEGTVVAGQTLTLTQRNEKALGQIIIDKSGQKSGKDLWNESYSLEGNVFEIRKETASGEVIQTITTNEEGLATTEKNLPLGIYTVTEKQASPGFVNTFEPATVEISYANQTTAVVIEEAKGTNLEVTGSTRLVKEDTETGNEGQGKATLQGAEYALLNELGESVKWNASFSPVLVSGTKADDEDIVVQIDDESLDIVIEHLPLGKYTWREVNAPEGYQKDKDRSFELTYKDQETEVVVSELVSKEQVIQFSLDGFKYVESQSTNTKTGYNDIEFSLTSLEGTTGETRTSITQTDENGFDGYWQFENIPYGDYLLKEETTPNGYKTIKDLIVRSSYEEDLQQYTFTITEEGQTEPLKTKIVSEEDIHQGSHVISLSKLFLTNHLIRIPEIRTRATVNGEKTFNPDKETPMHDKISLHGLYKDESYTNRIKLWRIQDDNYENAQLVFETENDFVAEAENVEQVIETLVDTTNDDEQTKYVWTEELFDEDGNKVAEHNDLTNEEQTVRPIFPGNPTIETLFITKDNKKEFDPTKDQELVDKVIATVPKHDVGKTFYYVTEFHKVDKDGNATVLYTDESKHVAEAESFEFEVVFEYKANMVKDGEKIVATHIAYTNQEYTEEYAEHFDLGNEKQTLTAKTPDKPQKPTEPNTSKKLPQTSGVLTNSWMLLALATVVTISGVIIFRKRKQNK